MLERSNRQEKKSDRESAAGGAAVAAAGGAAGADCPPKNPSNESAVCGCGSSSGSGIDTGELLGKLLACSAGVAAVRCSALLLPFWFGESTAEIISPTYYKASAHGVALATRSIKNGRYRLAHLTYMYRKSLLIYQQLR